MIKNFIPNLRTEYISVENPISFVGKKFIVMGASVRDGKVSFILSAVDENKQENMDDENYE